MEVVGRLIFKKREIKEHFIRMGKKSALRDAGEWDAWVTKTQESENTQEDIVTNDNISQVQ